MLKNLDDESRKPSRATDLPQAVGNSWLLQSTLDAFGLSLLNLSIALFYFNIFILYTQLRPESEIKMSTFTTKNGPNSS